MPDSQGVHTQCSSTRQICPSHYATPRGWEFVTGRFSGSHAHTSDFACQHLKTAVSAVHSGTGSSDHYRPLFPRHADHLLVLAVVLLCAPTGRLLILWFLRSKCQYLGSFDSTFSHRSAVRVLCMRNVTRPPQGPPEQLTAASALKLGSRYVPGAPASNVSCSRGRLVLLGLRKASVTP